MTVAQFSLSGLSLPFAALLVGGCLLDPKSAGDLEAMSDESGEGGEDPEGPGGTSTTPGEPGDDADDDGGEDDGEPPPTNVPGGCDDDCGPLAPQAWSSVMPALTDDTHVCDVAVGPDGRVAVAWSAMPDAEHPLGEAGIDLYAPDGQSQLGISVSANVFESIAFAKNCRLWIQGLSVFGENDGQTWLMALDGNLNHVSTEDYAPAGNFTFCSSGARSVAVDDQDNVVTYEYACGAEECGVGTLRRHSPIGTLLWERELDGNFPFGSAVDTNAAGEVFSVVGISYTEYNETQVRKFSPDGEELWMSVVTGAPRSVWATPDGGARAYNTLNAPAKGYVHPLASSGEVLELSDSQDDDVDLVFSPTLEHDGYFAMANDELRRLDTMLDTVWVDTVAHANDTNVAGAHMRDNVVAVSGRDFAPDATTYWVTVLTAQ